MPTKLIETNAAQTPLEKTRADLAVILGGNVKEGHACDKGDVMGLITADGQFRRRSRSTVKTGGAFTTASAAGKIVDASKIFKAGDVLKVLTAVLQQETATVAGTIAADGAGNAAVVVTSVLLPGGSKTFAVAVANNDTAAQVAGKIRTALAADPMIDEYFTVSGATTAVILTVKEPAAYDSTLNISVDNGTCTGLTTAATSANTTLGNAVGATLGTIDTVVGDDVTLESSAAINAGEGAIVVGSDGSETATCIAGLGTDDADDTGVPMYFGGYLDEEQLNGLDASAKTELGGRTLVDGIFKF